MFFKNSHSDLYLGLRPLNLELVQDIVILNIHVKLQQNQAINDDNVFLKITTVTLTLALECSNSNLSKILSY